MVRVRLVAHRAADPLVLRIGAAGQWLSVTAASMQHWSLTAAAPLTVQRDERGWRLTEPTGYQPLVPAEDALVIALLDDVTEAAIELNGRAYPGHFVLHPQPSFGPVALDVVNHVRLERYLPGVLARELFQHWHAETFLAQAIAARSFACSEIHFFRDRRHYDVTDTQRSQAYIGYTAHPRAVEAVEQTRGIVLGWRGEIVPAYYSACCGGAAARACDAINYHPANCIDPLAGNAARSDCSASPLYTWTVVREAAVLAERLQSFGRQMQQPPLASLDGWHTIAIAEVNDFERPVRFALRNHADETLLEVDAGLLQRAINYQSLELPTYAQALPSSFFTVERRGREIAFIGRGHGHGVGLCQYGAQHMATTGEGHIDILALYYPHAELVPVY